MTTPAFFYHIVTPANWAKFRDTDFYEADSLPTEGFIHASTAEQVEATLNRYYKGEPSVLLLHIEAAKVTSELRYELAPSVNEYFPHIYGPLNKTAVVDIMELAANEDGSYIFK